MSTSEPTTSASSEHQPDQPSTTRGRRLSTLQAQANHRSRIITKIKSLPTRATSTIRRLAGRGAQAESRPYRAMAPLNHPAERTSMLSVEDVNLQTGSLRSPSDTNQSNTISSHRPSALDVIEGTLAATITVSETLLPPLSTAAKVALKIVNHVRLYYSTNEDCIDLVQRASNFLQLLNEDFARRVTRVEQYSRRLEGLLEDTLLQLESRQNDKVVVKVMTAKSLSELIDSSKKKINDAVQEYQVSLAAWTAGEVHNLSSSSSSRSFTAKEILSTIPPPKPAIFHGRTDEVRVAVEKLLHQGPAHIPILGAGGMGKTSLALAILHDELICERFADRRYFLSCESASTAPDVVNYLVQMFSLRNVSEDPLKVLLSFLDRCDGLLVLDNFETVWHENNLGPSEDLLARLASVQHLSLIVTMRGSQLPGGVSWSTSSGDAFLEPLPLENALPTFTDHAKRNLDAEYDAVIDLLAAVDYMPLAIVLLARLAERDSPVDLMKEWYQRGVVLLANSTAKSSRERNMQVSIELSLSRMDPDSQDAQLLFMCSHFPDGLSQPIAEALDGFFVDGIHKSRRALQDLALVFTGQRKELRMLSPIRLYVRRKYLDSFPDVYQRLRHLLLNVAISSSVPVAQIAPVAARVAPDIYNITSFLFDQLSGLREYPDAHLTRAVISFSWFCLDVAPSSQLTDMLLPRLKGTDRIPCLAICASIALTYGQYAQAEAYATETIALAGSNPNLRAFVARAILLQGRCQYRLSRFSNAVQLCTEALNMFKELNRDWDYTDAMLALGDAHVKLSNFEEARKVLEECNRLCLLLGNECTLAWTFRTLAIVHSHTDQFDVAFKLFHEAHSIFERVGDQYSCAVCEVDLGRMQQDLGFHAEAEAMLTNAFEVFVKFEAPLDQADCLLVLAGSYYWRGEYQQTLECLASARELYQAVSSRNGVAETAWYLGQIRLEQEEYEEARDSLIESIDIFEKIGNKRGAAVALTDLSTAQQCLKNIDGARHSLTVAQAISIEIGLEWLTNSCSEWLQALE